MPAPPVARKQRVRWRLAAYQAGWLKCHYPAEFMAAQMSSLVDKIGDVVAYIAESRERGKYLPRVSRGAPRIS